MKIYKDIKKIADKVVQINHLCEEINHLCKIIEKEGIDVKGKDVDWCKAELVSGITVKDGYLYRNGYRIAKENDDYYSHRMSYFEGDDFGFLYFRTDVPGQYVEVYYEC